MSERVSIAREGKVIGECSDEELRDGLDAGRFLPEDHFFIAGMKEWRPLSTYDERRRHRSNAPLWDSPEPTKRHSKSRGRRGMRVPGLVMPLAVFCVVLLLAGLGLGTWVSLLGSENAKLVEEIARLKAQVESSSQRVSLGEMTKEEPPGWVSGRIEISPRGGGRTKSVASGVEVALFERGEIEAYLNGMAEQNEREIKQLQGQIDAEERVSGGADTEKLKGLRAAMVPLKSPSYFVKSLPAAIRNTVTDSNGLFRLQVPEQGEFVLCSRLQSSDPTDTGDGSYLWFIGVRADRKPNTPIVINEFNRTMLFSPGFFIQRID